MGEKVRGKKKAWTDAYGTCIESNYSWKKIVTINDKVQKVIGAQTYEKKKNHVSVDMVTQKKASFN